MERKHAKVEGIQEAEGTAKAVQPDLSALKLS